MVEVEEELDFVFCGRAGEEEAEGLGDFFFGGGGVVLNLGSEVVSDFDEHGVVHEGEGLEGGV